MKITISIQDPDNGEEFKIKRGIVREMTLDSAREAAEAFIDELQGQGKLFDAPQAKAGK